MKINVPSKVLVRKMILEEIEKKAFYLKKHMERLRKRIIVLENLQK